MRFCLFTKAQVAIINIAIHVKQILQITIDGAIHVKQILQTSIDGSLTAKAQEADSFTCLPSYLKTKNNEQTGSETNTVFNIDKAVNFLHRLLIFLSIYLSLEQAGQ